MNKFTLLPLALSLFCVSHKVTAQDTAARSGGADGLPIRMELKMLGSTKPGIMRFSVGFISLQRAKSVRVKVVNPRRPFRFRIIDTATGQLVNREDFPRSIPEDVKIGDLMLTPGKTVSFEVVYPARQARLKVGGYSVQAIMSVREFRVGDEKTELTDSVMLRSNKVDVRVHETSPTTVTPPNTETSGRPTNPTKADAAALPLAPEPLAQLPPSVNVGDPAPDFSVSDMSGKVQRLSDYRGKSNLLLTFFPKCFTGGCANHLSSLRDWHVIFQDNDVEVLAVSVDPADGEKGQKAFAKQWNLPFPLVPDTERKLSMLYGAAKQPTDLAQRMTVVIDKQGIVQLVDTNVNVDTHGQDMVNKLRDLKIITK